MTRLPALLLGLLCSGCLFPFAGLSQRLVLSTGAGDFEVISSPDEPFEQQRAARAIAAASQSLARWGKLDRTVSFYLLPSHLRLASAVGRYGYDWLHAWGRYDEVYFQSPATWGWSVSDAEVDELVLHELTHCLMYQRAATRETWAAKQIPLWFREGMATWTANQAYKFPSLEDLARFYETHPGADPIRDPDPLYKESNDIVYAAAHHAFTFLIRRYQEQTVHRLLDAMQSGQTFPEAFLQVTGISAAAFATEFRHYLVWRGFRGHGRPKPSLLLR
ncbi:MAG: hypothetical protein H6Q89_3042 [Myxococcaceae bacterium]|nr:hypothetical protein [Myxococcaceae bacterium]